MKLPRGKWAVVCAAALVSALVVAAWSGPLLAADAEAGGATFKGRCAMCHGSGGAGDGPMGKMLKPPPPDLSDAERMAERTDGELVEVITEGADGMPGYEGRLSESEIEDVVAYIRTLAE